MTNKIAAIQMTSGMDLDANLMLAKKLLTYAAKQGALLAVLPEMFPLMGKGEEFKVAKTAIQEQLGQGKIQDFLANEAKRLNMWIVGGTLPLASDDPNKNYAACLVWNAKGEVVAHYNKMHLFDVTLSETEFYKESESTMAGDRIIFLDTPVGRVGLSVCYDVRFPELYRAMFLRGAQVFVIPSAFTVPTGRAHWEILLRARAIENFCYVVAAAQWGEHGQGRKTFGHSMIVAPTGKVMTSLPEGLGVVMAEIDLTFLQKEREKIPVTQHQRIFCDVSAFKIGGHYAD